MHDRLLQIDGPSPNLVRKAGKNPRPVGNSSPSPEPILRVLVVDDELLLRWSISEALKVHGHTVLEAMSASTAREAISTSTGEIDVVLLDFRLPDSDDLRLLADIRQLTPASAVVLMTAFGTPEV